MTILRVHHTIGGDSGLPEDVTVNVFHFQTGANQALPAEIDRVIELVHEFYEVGVGAGSPLRSHLSVTVDPTTARIKVYDLSQPAPRPPVADSSQPLGAVGSTTLPRECAVVLSQRATAVPGVPPRRLRGRLYFGPLNGAVTTASYAAGDFDLRPPAAFRQALVDAGKRLMDNTEVAPLPLQWVVHSPTFGDNHVITTVHADNAFDTQRRRGAAATARTTATKAP